MLVRSNKGALPAAVLLLAFSWLMSGWSVSRKQIAVGALLVALCAVLFPVFMFLRPLRAAGVPLSLAFDALRAQHLAAGEAVGEVIKAIALRMNGAALLICIVESGARPLGWSAMKAFSGALGLAGYVTFQVFAAPVELWGTLFMSPSLIGLFYLLGGLAGAALGMAVVTAVVMCIWKALSRLGLATLPIAQAAFLVVMMIETNDGDLPGAAKYLVVCALSIGIVELLLRLDSLRTAIEVRTEEPWLPHA